MCGGIIGALSFGLPVEIRQNPWRFIPYLLAYNSGRIISYAVAGGLIGWLGSTLFTTVSPRYGHTLLQWIAAAFMVAIGLYLGGWFSRFAALENLGRPLWKKLEPLGMVALRPGLRRRGLRRGQWRRGQRRAVYGFLRPGNFTRRPDRGYPLTSSNAPVAVTPSKARRRGFSDSSGGIHLIRPVFDGAHPLLPVFSRTLGTH
jgi:hypothetical protein